VRTIHRMRLAVAMGIMAIVLSVPATLMAAVPIPAAEMILQRMLMTVAEIPAVVSADAGLRLRVGKPPSEPLDCIFRGIARVTSGRPTLKIDGRTAGLLCWAVNRYVIGQRFEATERLESFLSRCQFDVLGEKLVGQDPYDLVAGKAKDPRNDPTSMVGWIDFDRGLLIEGTVGHSWGSIDTEQSYQRMRSGWVLTHQYLCAGRFSASVEIVYTNFRVGSQ
jgi:hypothetical protein